MTPQHVCHILPSHQAPLTGLPGKYVNKTTTSIVSIWKSVRPIPSPLLTLVGCFPTWPTFTCKGAAILIDIFTSGFSLFGHQKVACFKSAILNIQICTSYNLISRELILMICSTLWLVRPYMSILNCYYYIQLSKCLPRCSRKDDIIKKISVF